MKPFNLIKLLFFFFLFIFIRNLQGQTITLLHSENMECFLRISGLQQIGTHFYFEYEADFYHAKEGPGMMEIEKNQVVPVRIVGQDNWDSTSVEFSYSKRPFSAHDYYRLSDTSGVFVPLDHEVSTYEVYLNGTIHLKELKYKNRVIDAYYPYWLNDKLIVYMIGEDSYELLFFDSKKLEFTKLIQDSIKLNTRHTDAFDSLIIADKYLVDTGGNSMYSINEKGDVTLLNPNEVFTSYSFRVQQDSLIYYTSTSRHDSTKSNEQTVGKFNMKTKQLQNLFTLSPPNLFHSILNVDNVLLALYGRYDFQLYKVNEDGVERFFHPEDIRFKGLYKIWGHRIILAATDKHNKDRIALFNTRNEHFIVGDTLGDIEDIHLVKDECFFSAKNERNNYCLFVLTTSGKIHQLEELTISREINVVERFTFKGEEYLIFGDYYRSNLYKYNPTTYELELVFPNLINYVYQGLKEESNIKSNYVVAEEQVYFIAQIDGDPLKFGVYEMR